MTPKYAKKKAPPGLRIEGALVVDETIEIPTQPGYITPFKFCENLYLDELKEYLASTYNAHYASKKDGIQTFELIHSTGQAEGFCVGNILKYASRYGKKNGRNRKDLIKIIHYTLLMLYVHDQMEVLD